jgi:CBS domain-containing protein
MSRDVRSIGQDDTLIQRMVLITNIVHHLPVMDEEEIIGIATIGDRVVATIKV